jgi:hypothetical protein
MGYMEKSVYELNVNRALLWNCLTPFEELLDFWTLSIFQYYKSTREHNILETGYSREHNILETGLY